MRDSILVVGSSGCLGDAVVSRLLKADYNVVAASRNPPTNQETSDDVPNPKILRLDVSNHSDCSNLTERLDAGEFTLKGMAFCAGVTRDRSLLLMDPDDWNEVLLTNLTGAFLVTKAILNHMLMRGGGSLVYLGSITARIGNPGQANYSASKAGLEALSRTIAVEYGPQGIRSNVLALGPIRTPMTQSIPERKLKAIRRRMPDKMMTEPSDVARWVEFLLSTDSSHMTGESLALDNGISIT